MKYTVEEYAAKMERMRGRRRVRTLDESDLLQVLDEARRGRWGSMCGGHVANAYGYPAETMRMAAFRLGKLKGYGVCVNWGNAKKSCASVPFHGGERPMAAWMDSVKRKPSLKALTEQGWDFIPEASVMRHLAQRRLDARRKAEMVWPASQAPEIEVTIDDSLSSGNCRQETDRVSAWFGGRAAVLASELRAEILRREPALATYARRAVQAAVNRQLARSA